jgi:hypothetical protein
VSYDGEGTFEESEREERRIRSGETILRAEASRALPGRAQLKVGAEAAFNTLEQQLRLFEDVGSGEVPVLLPSANVRVAETRGEAFATFILRLGARWTFDAGVSGEASRLEQSGDVARTVEFFYWKPSLQIARAIGDDDQVRLRFYRDVGQLDFEDFVANAEIIDSTNVAGNPDLRPQTSWRMEAAADWRFDKPGALTLTLFYWSIGDALDFIIVDSPNGAFDARGNIGDAQMFGVRLSLDLPIGFVPGARIRSEGLVQVSEATDPLTGQRRAVSGIEESTLDVEFRQDLPSLALAWGATFESERVTPEFRLDLISLEREADELELWVESTRIRGLKLRAFAEVALADERRDRWFFGPDRAGVRDGAENRTRRLSPVIGISAEGSF